MLLSFDNYIGKMYNYKKTQGGCCEKNKEVFFRIIQNNSENSRCNSSHLEVAQGTETVSAITAQ